MAIQHKENKEENLEEEFSETDKVKKETSKDAGQVMEEQIKLQFQSFSSNLTEEQQKEIDENLGDRQIKNRIYFIRHGKSMADEGNQNLQPIEAPLTEEAKREYEEVTKHLSSLGLTKENTYILYHEGWEGIHMKRVTESAEIIERGLKLSEERKDKSVEGADSTKKTEPIEALRYMEAAVPSSRFAKELASKLAGKENINCVSVIHKSNIGAIRQLYFKEDKEPVSLGHGGYKNTEIQEVDITKGEIKEARNWFDYGSDKNILNINSHNIDSGLLDILAEEKALKEFIDLFRDGKLQIFELQNLVNVYFMKHRELFEKYLLCDDHDMRVFCVGNLVKNGNFEFVEKDLKDLLNKEDESSLIRLVDSLFKIFNKEQIERFIDELAGYNKVGSWLNTEIKKKKLEFYLNYSEYALDNIREIRQKTLDERIKRGEDVIIPLGFEGEKYKTTEELLNGNGITVIEGEAGAGKSIKLLEIMEYLKPNDKNNLFPVYVSLGGKTFEQVKKLLREQTKGLLGSAKYKFVYLFDALDEAIYDNEDMKKFKEYIPTLEGRVIITSRFNLVQGLGFETLKLKSLDSSQVYSYISEFLYDEKKKSWEEWKNKDFIKDIETNPLMLSIVCNLLASDENLDNITNIVELYEKIVDIRLKDWEKTKIDRGTEKLKIKYKKKLLGDLAYDSILKESNIKASYINIAIENNEFYEMAMDNQGKNDIASLNMIFKKDKDGYYAFIHESFREYFAASNIAEQISDNTLDYDEFFYGLRFVSFNLLKILNDLLDNESKIVLLDKIKDNENYFSSKCHIAVVYLLGNLDREIMVKYLNMIEVDHEGALIDAIGELGTEEDMEIIMTYFEILGLLKKSKIISILGNNGYDKSIDFLGKLSTNTDTVVSYESINALVKINNYKSTEKLEELLNYDNESVRKRVESALLNLEEKKEVKNLSRRKYLKESIEDSLVSNACIPYLSYLDGLKENNSKKLIEAQSLYEKIGELEGEEKRLFVNGIMNTSKEDPRKLIVISKLLEQGTDADIELLKSFLINQESYIIIVLLNELGGLGREDNISFLKSFKKNKSREVRSAVIRNLILFGGDEGIKEAKTFRKDKSYNVLSTLVEELGKIGGKDEIDIIKSLRNKGPIVKKTIIRTLGRMGREHIDFIKSFQKDKDLDIVYTMISTLSFIGGKNNVEFIRKFLSYDKFSFVCSVISTLQSLGGTGNIEFIDDYFIGLELSKAKKFCEDLLGGDYSHYVKDFMKLLDKNKRYDILEIFLETLFKLDVKSYLGWGFKQYYKYIRSFREHESLIISETVESLLVQKIYTE